MGTIHAVILVKCDLCQQWELQLCQQQHVTALVVEVVVTADLAVKHSAMSPGKLEDTITHTRARACRHTRPPKQFGWNGEMGFNRNEIGKQTVVLSSLTPESPVGCISEHFSLTLPIKLFSCSVTSFSAFSSHCRQLV